MEQSKTIITKTAFGNKTAGEKHAGELLLAASERKAKGSVHV
jgi:hypothetical protein